MNKINLLFLALLLITLPGCAFDVIQIDQAPVQFKNTDTIKPDFELKDDVILNLETGYIRKLNKGTRWHYVGTINYGDIFKTKDQILTIEGSNIFEAYIVVSDSKKITGFFLPVERTFSPLSEPKQLSVITVGQ